MFRRSLPVVGLVLAFGTEALAQQPSGPPQVLLMTREQFRPGKMAEHNKQIPAFNALFERAKVGGYRLGLVPVSGDQNHLLYLEGYPSFAEMEATTAKIEAAWAASPAMRAEFDALTLKNDPLHESQTAWLARLRPDLSYRPNTMERTGKARYFSVSVTRVNTGRGADYADYVKQTNAAREKANLDEHTAVFQVLNGAPAGTYLVMGTSRSMSESDDFFKGLDARTKKMNEALGGEVVVRQRNKTFSEIVAQSTTTLYSIDRALSRPRPEFVAADPDFWKPHPEIRGALERLYDKVTERAMALAYGGRGREGTTDEE